MKCPHCHKELVVPEHVYTNADIYDKSVRTVTTCCGYGVMITPKRSYQVDALPCDKPQRDDWGNAMMVKPVSQPNCS